VADLGEGPPPLLILVKKTAEGGKPGAQGNPLPIPLPIPRPA